jgi:hypothetical protein
LPSVTPCLSLAVLLEHCVEVGARSRCDRRPVLCLVLRCFGGRRGRQRACPPAFERQPTPRGCRTRFLGRYRRSLARYRYKLKPGVLSRVSLCVVRPPKVHAQIFATSVTMTDWSHKPKLRARCMSHLWTVARLGNESASSQNEQDARGQGSLVSRFAQTERDTGTSDDSPNSRSPGCSPRAIVKHP